MDNLNDVVKDRMEWWEAIKKEQEARIEKMDAEERMSNTSTLHEFSEQASNAGDWLEADWDEFKARVEKWTNSAEIKADEAV